MTEVCLFLYNPAFYAIFLKGGEQCEGFLYCQHPLPQKDGGEGEAQHQPH